MIHPTLEEVELKNWEQCSLTKRTKTSELLETYVQNLKKIQEDYEEKLIQNRKMVTDNLLACQKMDSSFGVLSDNNIPDIGVERQKDGSLQVQCPILDCGAKTFKLKRHFSTAHINIPINYVNFACKISKLMAENKLKGLSTEVPAEKNDKPKRFQNTNLVSRKRNYKACCLCQRLVLNLPDHLMKTHKLNRNDPNYAHYVRSPEVIPKCLTKKENGQTVKLSGEELKHREQVLEPKLTSQFETHEKLVILRKKIDLLTKKIEENPDDADVVRELEELKEQYKEERFRDTRPTSPTMEQWKNSFLENLKFRNFWNPKRGVTMAMDTLRPYEEANQKQLTFEDLMDAKTLRCILRDFQKTKGTTSTTKIKYLSLLEMLINFLVFDVDSPETKKFKTAEELLTRGVIMEQVKYEIKSAKNTLSKDKGADIIRTKARAKAKLVTDEEINELILQNEDYLKKVIKDEEDGTLSSYSLKEALKVRNSLIAAATVRLGRRSQEMTTMTLDQVNEAEERLVHEEVIYIVKVLDQKSTKSGEPAPVVFTAEEYKVLKIFIRDLRPKLTSNASCSAVFPAKKSSNLTSSTQDLSLSAAWKILQTFKTSSGKKLTARSARASKVTNSRKKNFSQSACADLAKSMNHSLQTANRYYDFNDISDSVVRSLELEKTVNENSPHSSKFCETVDGVDAEMKNTVTSTPLNSQRASVTAKRKLNLEDSSDSDVSDSQVTASSSSEMEDADITVQNLRSKKIKQCDLKPSSDFRRKQPVKKQIEDLLLRLQSSGRLNELVTKRGNVSIKLITKDIPKPSLELLTTKEIRDTVKAVLNKYQMHF